MSHSRQTEHYELPLYDGGDIINPLTDFNNANSSIDEALYNANQRSVGAETTANEAKDIAEGYDTRVSQAIQTANDAMTLANNTQDMIADDFDPNKAGGYNVGDFVIYNGKLYRFINAHTGAWDASDVQVSPVLIEAIADVVDEGKQAINDAVDEAEQEIAGQTEKVTKTQAMIAQPFDANKSGGYAEGDIVTYADKLYKFTSAHSGAWTGLDVEQVDVVGMFPNVIKIDLDSTMTWKTVLNNIVSTLNTLGISNLTSIKDCKLIISKTRTNSSQTDVYRCEKTHNGSGDHSLDLSRAKVNISSTNGTLELTLIGLDHNPEYCYIKTGTILASTSSTTWSAYVDGTNNTIISSGSGYAEFIWE